MARYYGKIGYAIQEEVRPSVWQDHIVEQEYFGESNNLGWRNNNVTDQVNDNLVLNTDFDIVADAFMLEHFSQIRYICYRGARWTVRSIDYDKPRVHMQIGGVYNGPLPKA